MSKVIKRKKKLLPHLQLWMSVVFFLPSVQVILEGAGFVTALFTITILFVSRSHINECMRSLMTTMHRGDSWYTDAPFV